MKEAAVIADLFEQGRVAEIGPCFQALAASRIETGEECAISIYRELRDRGAGEAANQFLMSFAKTQTQPNDALFDLARRILGEEDALAAANLFMTYLQNGGTEPLAYDSTVHFAMTESRSDICIDVYERAQATLDIAVLADYALFNIAVCLADEGRLSEAVALYKRVIARTPDHEPSRANLTSIAKTRFVPEAIAFVNEEANEIAQSLPPFRTGGGASAPFILDWESAGPSEVEAAVNQNGFCYLRNGCDVAKLLAFRDFITEYEAGGGIFPTHPALLDTPEIEPLYRFDAKALTSAILDTPAGLDRARSVFRRVTPARRESFVPYHQDSTAFAKSLINIWTPLTPAGGEYPSLELVAKRVSRAEQTLIYDGEYNLVEIPADYVQERYKGLIYQVADARPGDCVIFLGTTIHRSANLRAAVKPRYNLEARWSELA